ncbi:hypothetical protein CcrC1_gp170 [Caulobacter phage C1]|nr:hypothetical protein CcrC1_gp170 [Caulobacter phage C1]UTU08399.1 hypothetical protein CcrC2_gp171 [Caulobacter phage C2]UTU08916.1 hypothetical protein CcrJ4_gp165 [Caulobacter phage J4]UTU09472.1 hypothetical protein CcrBL47_gp186 [Caulobacter phage BL47]UTU10032.1 hypothetical protein CcrRB23_gp170 [Caulobacter phage RB23]WGN97067.1 hypothetical protein [Bertelyvirus sp.]
MLSAIFGHLDLFGLIFGHPKLWLGILVLALAAGVIVFKGAFLKFLLNARTLLVIAVAVGLLSVASLKKDMQVLEAKNQHLTEQVQATADGMAAVTHKSKAQRVNAVKTARLHEVISNAQPDQALDDVLDEIAVQQGQSDPGGAGHGPVAKPDGVRHDQPDLTRPGSIDPYNIDRLR